jgi:transposase-like protein
MGTKRRTHYNEGFRIQAVELCKSMSPPDVAKKLNIAEGTIYRWFKESQTPDLVSPKLSQEELLNEVSLREQNYELKKINSILKKATAFFSQGQT